MKSTFTLLALLMLANLGFAQMYDGPESVEWDSINSRYLISNTGSNKILARAANGTLTTFATLANAPYGLEIVGAKLYACTGTKITVLNLTTGVQITQINCSGASFLNGITHDANGNVYATDFSAKKIYKINTNTNVASVYVSATVNTPNGIVFDQPNNRLVYACWGSNAKIKAVSLVDSSQTTLTTTTLTSIDGLTLDPYGNFYAANWGSNSLVRFNNNCTTNTTVMAGLDSPADICYNPQSDSIAIPNSGNNTVVFYFNILTGVKKIVADNFSIYPNPTSDYLVLNGIENNSKVDFEILDSNGKLLLKNTINTSNKIDVRNFIKGIYYLNATQNKKRFSKTFVKE